MALIHCDGFAHYGTLDEFSLAYSVNPTPFYFFENDPAILDHPYLRMSRFAQVRYPLTGLKTRLIMGGRFRFDEIQSNKEYWWELLSLSNGGGYPHHYVTVTNTGSIALMWANGATSYIIAQTSGGLAGLGTFHYIEADYTLGPAGNVKVYLNGALVLDFTGDTIVHAANIVSPCQFYYWAIFEQVYLTDFYIADETTAKNNAPLGDVRMFTLFPNADLAEQDWTCSSGVNRFDLLDNVPATNANYISAALAGDVSEFTAPDLPPNVAAVYGCTMTIRAMKNDAGTCKVFGSIVGPLGGVVSTPEFTMANTPDYFSGTIQNAPDGGNFSRANFNAAKFAITRSE